MNVRDELKGNTVEQNQEIARSTAKPFAVATFDLKGDLNLGTIMRTAHLCGAKDFFILNHRAWDRRSAVGVHNYIPVHRHDECKDWVSTAKLLMSKNYLPFVVEQGGMEWSLWRTWWRNSKRTRYNYTTKQYEYVATNGEVYHPCFIFGPEDTGFPEDWPRNISLQQAGVTRSFNVSSAAAILLYDWSFRG